MTNSRTPKTRRSPVIEKCDLYIVSGIHGRGNKSLVVAWATSLTSPDYQHGVHTNSKAIEMLMEGRSQLLLEIEAVGQALQRIGASTKITVHADAPDLFHVIDDEYRQKGVVSAQWQAVAGGRRIAAELEPLEERDRSDGIKLAERMMSFRLSALKKPHKHNSHRREMEIK